VPERDRIEQIVLRQHPKLLRLRAQFAIAEKRLRLEAARALPEIDMGFEMEDEGPDTRLALPLGIELPIFPKGAKELAEAEAERERIRQDFTTTLGEILGAVEAARARVHLRQRRIELIETQRATAAEAIAIARRARDEAGSVDSMRYLTVLRAARAVEAAAARADAALHEAWMELEVALGVPLVSVRDEPRAVEVVMPAEPAVPPAAAAGETEEEGS
jgi:outer membrane protein TolC